MASPRSPKPLFEVRILMGLQKMKNNKIILGITGTNGAGKGTVVEYLVKQKNFKHFSASGLISEEIERMGLPVNRENMIVVGNELREKYGADVIVERLMGRAMGERGNIIIESIRTLAEVKKIKENGGILLAVDADQKLRYERNEKRRSNKDGISFEQFLDFEEKESQSVDSNKQNLVICRQEADYIVENNGSVEELHQKIEEILKIIENNG